MAVTIQRAEPAQVDDIKEILKKTWMCAYTSIFPPQAIEKITGVWHARETLLAQMSSPDVYSIVAVDDGVVVGVASVWRQAVPLLTMLYVDPEVQGKGVGSMLLGAVLEEFSSAPKLQVEVEVANRPAVRFYEKKGFVRVTEREEEVEGFAVKTVVMEKGLSA